MSTNNTYSSSNRPVDEKQSASIGFLTHAAHRKQRRNVSFNYTGPRTNRLRGGKARTERNIPRLAAKDVPAITTPGMAAFTVSLNKRASDVDHFPPVDENDFHDSDRHQGALPYSLSVAELDSGDEIRSFLKLCAFSPDGTVSATILTRVDKNGQLHAYNLPTEDVQVALRFTSHFQHCRDLEEIDKVTRYCFTKQGYYSGTTSLFTPKGLKTFLDICEVFKNASLAAMDVNLDEVAHHSASHAANTSTLSPQTTTPVSEPIVTGNISVTLETQDGLDATHPNYENAPTDAEGREDITKVIGEPKISEKAEGSTNPPVLSQATVDRSAGQGEKQFPPPIVYRAPVAQMAKLQNPVNLLSIKEVLIIEEHPIIETTIEGELLIDQHAGIAPKLSIDRGLVIKQQPVVTPEPIISSGSVVAPEPILTTQLIINQTLLVNLDVEDGIEIDEDLDSVNEEFEAARNHTEDIDRRHTIALKRKLYKIAQDGVSWDEWDQYLDAHFIKKIRI